MSVLSDIFEASLEQVRKSWGRFLILGILLIFLGGLCIVKAQTATAFSILALGWVLMFSGVLWFIGSFYAMNWGGFFPYLLNAVLAAVVGYILVRHPTAGAEGVTILIGALFIVGGIYRAIVASLLQFPRWGWMLASGLISIFLGVWVMIIWQTVSSFFFGMIIGVDLICDGASLVAFATAIHSLPHAAGHPKAA